MKSFKVEINGKTYIAKPNIRTRCVLSEKYNITFEYLINNPDQEHAHYKFLYCMLIANNDFSLDFFEFLDYLEEHPEVLKVFNEYGKEKSEKK